VTLLYALVSHRNRNYYEPRVPEAWKDAIRDRCFIEAIEVQPPQRPKAEDAIEVQVACGSLNYSDLNMVHAGAAGLYGKHAVFGAEIAGWVRTARKSSAFKEGDLVVSRLLSRCRACSLCDKTRHRCILLAKQPRAAFQERLWLPEASIRKIPAGISPLQAAALQFSAAVALDVLERCLDLKPGQTLLIAGANSGIGTYLTQIAAGKRLTVINLIRSKSAMPHCLKNGAAAALVTTSDHQVNGCQAQMYSGQVDAAIDLAADFYGPQCLKLLKTGSTYIPVGWSGSRSSDPVQLHASVGSSIQLLTYRFQDGHNPLALLRDQQITPAIDSIYHYTEVEKACERAWWSQGRSGKVLIRFADPQACTTAAQVRQ